VTLEALVMAAHAAQATIGQEGDVVSLPEPSRERVLEAEAVVKEPLVVAEPPAPAVTSEPALPGGATLGDIVS
jgi:hypothetical protein